MALKKALFNIKGMTRDLAASKFSPEYAYENKNLRLEATDDNTTGVLVNEKGTQRVNLPIIGTPLGYATIDDSLVLFSTDYQDVTTTEEQYTNELPSPLRNIKAYKSYKEALHDQNGETLHLIYSWGDDNYYAGNAGDYIGYTDTDDWRKVASPITENSIPVLRVNMDSDYSTLCYTTEIIEEEEFPLSHAVPFKVTIREHENDRIYTYKFTENGELVQEVLYTGNLNFDVDYPIECVSVYESNELKKVYWTDGRNQPRVINVSANSIKRATWNDNTFDFVRRLGLKENITIKRNIVASGYFAPGVLQYCFTYLSLYGQETNIFYTSPLYYVSYNNRGASPEDTVSNSFTITIQSGTEDLHFDYIRVYSILRTSLNATPQVRRVVDLATSNTGAVYVDNGIVGETIDPTELLYIGGEPISAGTFAQKDNTLFLGDIEVKRKFIDSEIRSLARNLNIQFGTRLIQGNAPSGLYPYNNQLKNNSTYFRTLKYLEYYRFGIQAQHYTGRWSEPIFIADKQNTTSPNIDEVTGTVFLPYGYTQCDSEIISKLAKAGYVKIRPVIVYPELNEREVVCQGVLCPTVYNVGDRESNAPFAQSSWFFRPNSYLDVEGEKETYNYPSSDVKSSWAAQVRNDYIFPTDPPAWNNKADNFLRGKWVEFRHNHPIPSNNEENAEIQCIVSPPPTPYITNPQNASTETWVAENMENFYIDQSIVTLHSPDIEFDKQVRSLDTSGLKLRIIGAVNLTASASDISIQSETPVNNFVKSGGDNPEHFKEMPIGFYKENIGTQNVSKFGWRSIVSGGFWFDDVSAPAGFTLTRPSSIGFVVYPWHRSLSYNNAVAPDTTGYISAKVGKKKLSILRYSCFNTYLSSNDIWKADTSGAGISDVVIFDSNEMSMIRVKAPANSGLDDINYYGNIDKLVTFPSSPTVQDKKDGYPIITTTRDIIEFPPENQTSDVNNSLHILLSWDYHKPDESWYREVGIEASFYMLQTYTSQTHALDPVSIKYKSTPHAVIALNYNSNHEQVILPTNSYTDSQGSRIIANLFDLIPQNQYPFWDKSRTTTDIHQDSITNQLRYGYLWLAELYNDNVQNRFGGTSEEAFENNVWLPAGEAVSLYNGSTLKSSVVVRWKDGDTYYQRYDCLKTYPFTMEDQNSVVDILSFMCETRVNIDGRYDRNRGQTSNLVTTPSNFNLINDVYSQKDNFFSYRGINYSKINERKYPNTITWTKTKTLGEEADTWTNITLASTIDLDGDLGKVRAIRKLNDSLLTFQDRGISQILYNENIQIASTTGVPIEIANSGKVSGKRYVSNHIGCTNKWSICNTPSGLYFLDTLGKDLYLFNGQFNNLSDRLGFHSWVTNNLSTLNTWSPKAFDSCVTYYDKNSGDVMFITKDTCLSFSESAGQFMSFYDYGDTPYFINLKDKGIMFHKDDATDNYYPYYHREGEYNNFFGEYQPFWTTVIVNQDVLSDKVFNNIEFNADSFGPKGNYLPEHTFNRLTTWNEYQKGTSSLTDIKDFPSSLKKKFRTWRANIPRWNVAMNGQTPNGRDRMRNPWLYLQLKMEDNTLNPNLRGNRKTVLHNLIVDYFE